MMDLTYQPATTEDVPVIFAQCCELVDRYEDKSLICYDKVIAWLQNKIETNIGQYTCVVKDGQKVAFYRLVPEDTVTELDDFYVLPGFRGKGIGSAILEKCISETENPLCLYVFQGNVRAVSFYKRHGFQKAEQVSPTRMTMIHHT